MSVTQLQELLATMVQTIQSEITKQTAALLDTMDSKLTSAIEKFKSEISMKTITYLRVSLLDLSQRML